MLTTAALSRGFVSWVVLEPMSVSVMMVPAAVPRATRYFAVIVPTDPGGTLELVQEIGETGGHAQVPPPVVTTATETKVVFAGVASVKVAELQFAGPLFVMVCVYVIVPPAATGLGVPLLVTARSQTTFTLVVTLVLLLEESGSEVVAETEEEAVIVAAVTVAGTFTTMMMSAEDAVATDGLVQVIVPVAPTAGVVQVHPGADVMDWNVVFVGVASVKVAPDAVAGPLFVIVWVYVMLLPTSTVEGVAAVLRARSAWVALPTTSVAVAELGPKD